MSARCNWRKLNSLTVTTALAFGPTISVSASDLTEWNPFTPPCFRSVPEGSGIIEATARNPIILASLHNPGFDLPTPDEQWQNCFVDWTDPYDPNTWTPVRFANPSVSWCARVDSPCGLVTTAPAFRKPDAGPVTGYYLAFIDGDYLPAFFTSGETFGALQCFDFNNNPLGAGSFTFSYT